MTTDDDESIEFCSEEPEIAEDEHTTINNYSEAIQALKDVGQFLEQKGHSNKATTVCSFVSTVVELSNNTLASCRQSCITDFFQKN